MLVMKIVWGERLDIYGLGQRNKIISNQIEKEKLDKLVIDGDEDGDVMG